MFDNRWDNWAGDFADSTAASALGPQTREYLTDILREFGAAVSALDPDFPDELSPGTFAAVLSGALPRLNLPESARSEVPEAVASFFEYLGETGRLGEAAEWAASVRALEKTYRERLRPGGGVKGVTIQKSAKVSPLGRNDPCPCGSGKKFKKCCMTRG